MFQVNEEDRSIYVTRGDVMYFGVTAMDQNGDAYTFKRGDVVRLKVYQKKKCDNVLLEKTVEVETESESVEIFLDENDTKIGKVINKPTDYWYEVELNPDTCAQTIIGYDEDGAKIFRLYPEGGEYELK